MIGVDGVESEDEHDWQRRTGARKQMESEGGRKSEVSTKPLGLGR